MNKLIATLLAFGAAAGALGGTARAASLQVDPIRLEISAGKKIASLTVRNEEKVPVTIRAYALAWSQENGEDRYSETNNVIVSPPIFTVPAHGTQVVRLGLRSPAAGHSAYRVMVEEVPQASQSGGVQVSLRLNLPLFADLEGGKIADLSWSAFQEPGKGWVVEASNPGKSYVRAEPAEIAASTGVAARSIPGFGVVLPGSRKRWSVGERPDFSDRARFQNIVRKAGHDGPTAP